MLDREILQAALEGLQAQRAKLDEQIAKVQALIEKTPMEPKPRRLSDEAREKIVEAQKRRWETFRKQKKGGK